MASYVTTIMLDHTFITGASGLSNGFDQRPVQKPPQEPVHRPVQVPSSPEIYTQPAPTTQTSSVEPNRINNEIFQCGNPSYIEPVTTALVIGGKVARRGQFPW